MLNVVKFTFICSSVNSVFISIYTKLHEKINVVYNILGEKQQTFSLSSSN